LKRFLVMCAAMVAISAASARAEVVYDFNDGTTQGWTSLDLANPSTGASWVWTVGTGSPEITATYGNYVYPGVSTWGSPTPQDAEHSTRIFRSPEFVLDTTGNISAYLDIGKGNAATVTLATLSTTSSSSGFLGLALRDAETGEYVAWTRRTSDSTTWELCIMDLTGIDRSKTYTLNLIDSFNGGFGWVAMDSVTIGGEAVPEPGTLTLLGAGLVVLAAYVWRKR
jgi:hypothetical protein